MNKIHVFLAKFSICLSSLGGGDYHIKKTGIGRLSLHTSHVARHTGAYPGFSNMTRLRVFLTPSPSPQLGGMPVHCRVTPSPV